MQTKNLPPGVRLALGLLLSFPTTLALAAEPDRLFVDGLEACSMMSDADGDRLYECDEVYAQTNPASADTDLDGLSDGDEKLGTLAGLNLPALGVNPRRKDILIEYDWAEDATNCAPHSHALTPAQYESIRLMFANAPVPNPDGSTGINVIQDYGQGGLFTGGNVLPLVGGFLPGQLDGPERLAIKAAHFDPKRQKYFHYATLVHTWSTPSNPYSGKSDFHNDFVTGTSCWGLSASSDHMRRNTAVHELGHGLGLWHGGPWGDQCMRKPNYNSVMNYRYQFHGYDQSCKGSSPSAASGIDRDVWSAAGFSFGVRPPLDESALDEHAGVCGHLPNPPPLDWNGNGVIEPWVQYDINSHTDYTAQLQEADCGGSGYFSVLNDHDDWAALDLTRVASDPGPGGGGDEASVDCPAPESELLP